MIACFIIIGLAVVLLFFYVYFKSKKYDLKELFLKIGLSFLFIILALIATINSNKLSTFNILIIGEHLNDIVYSLRCVLAT